MKRISTFLFTAMLALIFSAGAVAQDRILEVMMNGEVVFSARAKNIDYITIKSIDYVDLGLPSGTMWATCNLGANTPEEYGNYYGWGSVNPYESGVNVGWSTYFTNIGGAASEQSACGTDADPIKDYVYPNNNSIASTKWDAAHTEYGGEWRMPTIDEFKELMNTAYCTWTWTTTDSGVNGYTVTSISNGNSIFLPAAGYREGSTRYSAGTGGRYWSASPSISSADNANFIYFDSESHNYSTWLRIEGYNIRPVYIPEPEVVDLALPSGLKWSTCNLGASKPEEYGNYYGWGCTEPYKSTDNVNWTTYFTYIGGTGSQSSDCGTNKDPLKSYVYPNNVSIAGTKWDAAHTKFGGSWRMPTLADIQELSNTENCTWTWTTTESGVKGYIVTSVRNGNSIFLPATGHRDGTAIAQSGTYGRNWSASPMEGMANNVYYLLTGNRTLENYTYSRYDGQTIRPVKE